NRDRAAKGPHHHSAPANLQPELGNRTWVARDQVGCEFDRAEQAKATTNLRNHRMITSGTQCRLELSLKFAAAGQQSLFFNDVKVRQSGNTTRWMPGVRRALTKCPSEPRRPQRLGNRTSDDHTTERQVSGGHPLRENDHVGRDAEAFDAVPGAESSEPADHRVAYKQHSVAPTDLRHRVDIAFGRQQNSTGTHHRLAEERGHSLRADSLKLLFKCFRRVVRDNRSVLDQRSKARTVGLDPPDCGAEAEHTVKPLGSTDHMRAVRLPNRIEVEPG